MLLVVEFFLFLSKFEEALTTSYVFDIKIDFLESNSQSNSMPLENETCFDESKVSEPSSPSSSDDDAECETRIQKGNKNISKFCGEGVVWNISTFENGLNSVEEVKNDAKNQNISEKGAS